MTFGRLKLVFAVVLFGCLVSSLGCASKQAQADTRPVAPSDGASSVPAEAPAEAPAAEPNASALGDGPSGGGPS